MTERISSAEQAVDRVLERVGGDIRLGLPLGLGKPNRFVNALYRRACQDPHIRLTIYTALTLGRPRAGSDLEQRFLAPFIARVFGDHEDLDYLRDLRRGALPDNVVVSEFFFQPGAMLSVDHAQQHYISTNYTHVARDLNSLGVNVVAQMVAPAGNGKVSLSCNPEVTLDILPLLQARHDQGEVIVAIGQLHRDLPCMGNDALVDETLFDVLVDDPAAHTTLFSSPNMPVELQDHFVGLHASTLLRDDGMIQIGIGSLGDALVHHALTRAHNNARYRDLVQAAGGGKFDSVIKQVGGLDAFSQGLYGCSEMVTSGLLALLEQGVIRRPVYADLLLQKLVNEGLFRGGITLAVLHRLVARGAITQQLNAGQLAWLKRHGILVGAVSLEGDHLCLAGQYHVNDLGNDATLQALAAHLGDTLQGGILLHGGFFLGPRDFYQRLRDMSDAERASINLTRISYVNHLFGDEELKRAQRQHARFFNTAFTMTLLGAGVADQIDSGRVLSGVGGQYNFVAQAHELEDGRSILMLRSWRERGGEAASNMVWSYAHNTIPRHLRDLVVTEYGIADLRGRNDSEVVRALLNISDSRFQDSLMEQARAAGKLPADYRIPEPFRYNTPERLAAIRAAFRATDFPAFPLGSDFDDTEQTLLSALAWLKRKVSQKEYLQLARTVLADEGGAQRFQPHLERMGLAQATTLRERIYRRLLLAALQSAAAVDQRS